MNTQVPSQRWALPSDSRWDIHYPSFERWVNDEYDMKSNDIVGFRFESFDDALQSDELMDFYVDMLEQARGEMRAERYYD